MRTETLSSLSKRQKTASKAVGIIALSGLTGLAIWKASSATVVVAGKVAAVGAIKTATVMTSAGPVVLSVVKAGLAYKIVMGISGVLLAGFGGLLIWAAADACFEKWNARDKSKVKEFAQANA